MASLELFALILAKYEEDGKDENLGDFHKRNTTYDALIAVADSVRMRCIVLMLFKNKDLGDGKVVQDFNESAMVTLA